MIIEPFVFFLQHAGELRIFVLRKVKWSNNNNQTFTLDQNGGWCKNKTVKDSYKKVDKKDLTTNRRSTGA
jgi:hypothetical protein